MSSITSLPERALARVHTLPAPHPGQFGPAHRVVEVIRPNAWPEADPFILLMDDRLDGLPNLGPHPHAGFETVTFLVEGDAMPSEGGGFTLEPGDVEWITAGRGIVHGPDKPFEARVRALQLWLKLPSAERWTAPDHQLVRAGDALLREEPGARIRLYSGRSGGLVSPTRNRAPVTLVDVQLQPGAAIDQELPAGWTAFLYALDGQIRVGDRSVGVGQVGWVHPTGGTGDTRLRVAHDGDGPARVLLYAGEPQRTPLVSYGPFIGESREDITRAVQGYQAGGFERH